MKKSKMREALEEVLKDLLQNAESKHAMYTKACELRTAKAMRLIQDSVKNCDMEGGPVGTLPPGFRLSRGREDGDEHVITDSPAFAEHSLDSKDGTPVSVQVTGLVARVVFNGQVDADYVRLAERASLAQACWTQAEMIYANARARYDIACGKKQG